VGDWPQHALQVFMPLPAEDAWAKQGSNHDEQQAVDEQAEVGHGSRSCEGESERVCPLRGVYVSSTLSGDGYPTDSQTCRGIGKFPGKFLND
jgi:hypothetical protein